MSLNIRSFLDFERHGNAVAFVSPAGEATTYSQFAELCDQFGARLKGPKSVLLLQTDNSLETFVAMFAALRAGHAVALADGENDTLVENLSIAHDCEYIYNPTTDELTFTETSSSDDIHPDLALLLSTSGSTGSSKSVRISIESLVSNACAIAEYLNINSGDTALLTLPVHYCYGLSVVNSHLWMGGRIVTGQASLTDPRLKEILQTNEVGTFPCVPFSINVLEKRGFRDWELPHLRYITQAGGALAPDLVVKYAKWAADTNRDFFVMYGQTEATARMAYMGSADALCHPDCIGNPIPGGSFSLIDEEGHPISKANTPGELIYSGPNVMMGYATSRSDLSKGRDVIELKTGDVAERSDQGLFKIVGRMSRFSKLYGKRLNLQDVEKHLKAIGFITSVVSDDQKLLIAVEGNANEIKILDALEAQFGVAPSDAIVVEFDQIPTLPSGKPDYASLKSNLTDREDETVQQNSSGDPMLALQRLYSDVFRRQVKNDESFRDLEGDSLRYVEISIGIENIIGELPKNWERLSIRELSLIGGKKIQSRWLSDVEPGILIRVLATLFVVANHAGMTYLAGGAVTLFLAAGHNFGRFQLPGLFSGKAKGLVTNLSLNVLLPFWGLIFVFGFLKSDIAWFDLFLIGNYVGSGGNPGFGSWFIQALIHSILPFALLLSIEGLRSRLTKSPALLIWGFLGFSVGLRVLDQALDWGANASLIGGQTTWVMWLFALGVAIANVNDHAEKLKLTAAIIALPLVFYWGDLGRTLYPITAGLALLWMSRIAVPKLVKPMLTAIGSASIFIYMLHPRAPIDSFTSDWHMDVVRIAVGVLLGLIGWKAYSLGMKIAGQVYRQIRT